MGILGEIRQLAAAEIERRMAAIRLDAPAPTQTWAAPTPAGITVTDDVAMTYSALWACVTLISETMGSLPLGVYQRRKNGRGADPLRDHPLWSILHDASNPEQTAMEFRESTQAGLLMRGNGYAFIESTGRGQIIALIPLRPDRMEVERDGDKVIYIRTRSDGQREVYPSEKILHIRGFASDGGLVGKSPIDIARDAVGLGLASQQFGSRFFGEGTHPSVVIKHPAKLKQATFDNLKKSLESAHAGLGNSHKMMLLEEGMDIREMGVSPEAAQFLETRQFQRSEVAAIFRVPLVLIDSTVTTTWGTGVESILGAYQVHTIRPWAVRWEQALNRKLLTEQERASGIYCRYNLDALVRATLDARYRAYATGRQWGWLSVDDVRDLENLNPLEDGKGEIYLTPANMNVAGQEAQNDES